MSRESSKCYLAHSRIHYNTLVFGGKIHVRIWGKRVARGLGKGHRVKPGQQKHRVDSSYTTAMYYDTFLYKENAVYRKRFPLKFSFAFITPHIHVALQCCKTFCKSVQRREERGFILAAI